MAIEGDFNYTKVLEQVINRPIEASEIVSNNVSTEGEAISGLFIFVIFAFLGLIILGAVVGGFFFVFNRRKARR